MSEQFYFKQFSLAQEHSLVLFDPYIGPYQVLPLWARVDLGVMTMKGYSTFPQISGLEPHHQMQFSVTSKTISIWPTDGTLTGTRTLEKMVMKEYSIFTKAPGLEPYH